MRLSTRIIEAVLIILLAAATSLCLAIVAGLSVTLAYYIIGYLP